MLIRIIAVLISILILGYSASAQDSIAEYWIQKGHSFYENGSYNEAIDSYNRAIGIQPGNSEAWKGQGLSLAKL
ncbi:MAG: tetratricopeptide repeat protein, partial [Methanotrichaceae archaeon]|nr:tetratricopeptide repeat protein [Methanotrichaceae archaeon]